MASPCLGREGITQIRLTRGLFALIDTNDLSLVSNHVWHAHVGSSTFYASTNIGKYPNQTVIKMHNLIMGEKLIDHLDGDGLNNCRMNLRICTSSQNSLNRRKIKKETSSKYKGVSWDKNSKKWRVRIQKNGVMKTVGFFISEVDASNAYDNSAHSLHGEFARKNSK